MSKFIRNPFTCKNQNLTIGGFSYLPSKYNKTQKLTPIIMSHGFHSNYTMCETYAQAAATEGFAAFTFDFNGGGPTPNMSSGKVSSMSVLTEVEDLNAVINYVSTLDYVDMSKLILLGCSQGGFVSALLAARLKEKVSKLILFYPAFCIPDDARRGQMIDAIFDPANIPEHFKCGQMELGKQYVTTVNQMDVYKEIEPYKGPVCLIHGDDDSLVNVGYSKKAYEVYTKEVEPGSLEAKQKQIHIIHGGTHVFQGIHDEYAVEILKHYLKNHFEVFQANIICTGNKETGIKNIVTHNSVAFGGNLFGPYFNGEIQEGATDEQKYNFKKFSRLCATYTIKGKDYTGSNCTINIVNKGNGGIFWTPTIKTDSRALNFLNTHKAWALMEFKKEGPFIRFYTEI